MEGAHAVPAQHTNARPDDRLQRAVNVNQGNTMNKVIAFPDKVFPQWGAVAQALTAHLRHLGASNGESREIVLRLQARWEQLGVPLAVPALRLIPDLLPGQENDGAKVALNGQAAQISRHWTSESARTLLELARLEYGLSQAV
jgi:hypothetical protein